MVKLGIVTKEWGKIAAIACISGERFYFMVDDNKDVAMMPATLVEDMYWTEDE